MGTTTHGQRAEVEIFAGFNNRVLEITEDTPILGSVIISYLPLAGTSNRVEKSFSVSFNMYNRNAMKWDIQEKLASFITYKEPSVRYFSRNIVQKYKNHKPEYLVETVFQAMLIFDAIGAYGVKYVIDPTTPYEIFSEKPNVVDYVQYPIETLKLKTGDCDDHVVLYAAMLQSIGISTALIDFPGHVLLMFNTGVPVEEAFKVSPDISLILTRDEYVWVPVEVTMYGESFFEAWKKAIEQYLRTPKDKKYIINIEDAWKKYAPVTLPLSEWIPSIPASDKIESILKIDMNSQKSFKISYIKHRYAELIESGNLDYRDRNRLGIIYARTLLFEKAIESFKEALQLKQNYLPAHINLGCALYKSGKVQEAIQVFKSALELKKDALIYYNLGVAYYKTGNYNQARKQLRIASDLDPKYEEIYIAMLENEEVRSKEEYLELDIEWYK